MSFLNKIFPRKVWQDDCRLRVNPFTLSFEPELEKQFQEEFFKSSLIFVRISFIFGMIFYSIFLLLDLQVANEHLFRLIKIRFLLVDSVILIVFIFSFFSFFKKYWQTFCFLATLIAGMGIIMMLIDAPKIIEHGYYVGIILVLIYGYFLIKLRYLYASFSGIILIIMYLLVDHYLLDLPSMKSFSNAFFLISCNLALMLGSYFIEYYTRRDYYTSYLLNQEQKNVELINQKLEEQVYQRTRKINEINQKLKKQVEALNQSQTELMENEEQLRIAFDSSNTSIWGMDIEKKILYLNEVCVKILDYPPGEVKDIFYLDDIHKDDQRNFDLAIDKISNRVDDKFGIEFRMKSYFGEWKWLRAWGKITTNNQSHSSQNIVGIMLDITKRKNNELELKKYRQSLEESVNERTLSLESSQRALMFLMEDMNIASDQLEKVNEQLESVNKELESFSYSVSHDLKSPLRAIEGFSQALLEDYYHILDDNGKEYLNLIHSNTMMMNQLISDLLEFSRLGRKVIKKEEINFEKMIKTIYETLMLNISDRKIDFVIDNIPKMKADLNLMRQVFINLISNAIKFTAKETHTRIKVGYLVKGDEHIIYVKDNGVGFDMKYADKLFGVFQRLHSNEEFEGYGVGLSLVKRIITRHNGKIWAESEIDQGATFFIALPKEKEKENTIEK